MIYYHGTDFESAMQILKTGFKACNRIWAYSYPNKTYMVGSDNETNDISFAVEAGINAAAHKNSNNHSIAVFQFDIPDDVAEDYMSEDISADNDIPCWEIESTTLNNLISKRKIKLQLYTADNAYIPELRTLYIANLNYAVGYNIDDSIRDYFPEIQNAISSCNIINNIYPCYSKDMLTLYPIERRAES